MKKTSNTSSELYSMPLEIKLRHGWGTLILLFVVGGAFLAAGLFLPLTTSDSDFASLFLRIGAPSLGLLLIGLPLLSIYKPQRLMLEETGITHHSWIKKTTVPWSEITSIETYSLSFNTFIGIRARDPKQQESTDIYTKHFGKEELFFPHYKLSIPVDQLNSINKEQLLTTLQMKISPLGTRGQF